MAKPAKKNPLHKTEADSLHAVGKALSSLVPGGAEIFNFLVAEPLSKRRDKWIEELDERLNALEQKMGSQFIDGLRHDESFTTVVVNASQIAVRNHQTEKLEALQNAVINSALGLTPDETERAIFLDLIGRLTPTHIAILRLFQSPASNPAVKQRLGNTTMGGLNHVIAAAFPELGQRRHLVDLIWRDLSDAGLLTSGGLGVTMTGGGMLQKRTTEFGDRFLRFIETPKL